MTEKTADAEQQGTHQFILTLDMPGRDLFTRCGTYTPGPGQTRAEAFEEIRDEVERASGTMRHTATIIFFSLEPNQL